MPSRGCPLPPEGRGWGPAKSPCGGGSAGGPAVAWCSGSVLIVTGGTNTAASAAGRKRGANNGGTPTSGTRKVGKDGSITATGNGPTEPHSATADFDLVRMEMAREVSRERWTLSLQFLFLEEIPPDLIVSNPMGIIINYLQGDRATVTGDQ